MKVFLLIAFLVRICFLSRQKARWSRYTFSKKENMKHCMNI